MSRPNVSHQRKKEILDAAAQVFTTQGLNIARMEDVASAAKISKGTIYLYYTSKEQLIEALLHRMFQPLDEALSHLIGDDRPFQDRAFQYAQEVLAIFDQMRDLHPLILELFALARRHDFAGKIFEDYFSRYRDALSDILQAAANAGKISLAAFSNDVHQAALSFISTLEGVLLLTMIAPAMLNIQNDGTAVMQAWLAQI